MENTETTQHNSLRYPIIIGVILIVVVFLVGLVAYKMFTKSPNQAATTPSETATVAQPSAIVSLTKDGFSPKVVTIQAGGYVRWVNDSGVKATVNSNPHPLNNAYRPLNLGEFGPGQTVQLIFQTPGTYTYHNYLIPSEQGQVIVKLPRH